MCALRAVSARDVSPSDGCGVARRTCRRRSGSQTSAASQARAQQGHPHRSDSHRTRRITVERPLATARAGSSGIPRGSSAARRSLGSATTADSTSRVHCGVAGLFLSGAARPESSCRTVGCADRPSRRVAQRPSAASGHQSGVPVLLILFALPTPCSTSVALAEDWNGVASRFSGRTARGCTPPLFPRSGCTPFTCTALSERIWGVRRCRCPWHRRTPCPNAPL